MESEGENTEKGRRWVKPVVIVLAVIALYFFVTAYLYPMPAISLDSTTSGTHKLKTNFEPEG